MKALTQKNPNPASKPPVKPMLSATKPQLSKPETNTSKLLLPFKEAKFIKQEIQKESLTKNDKDNNFISPAIQEWHDNRKKWLQKTKKQDGNEIKLELPLREISIADYGNIEKIIKAITPPYQPFKTPIKLSDMVEILDDIWEEDNE